MSNFLEASTISDWVAVISLLLVVGGGFKKIRKTRIDILCQLRTFKWKLKFKAQIDSEENVMLIQNTALDYLYKVKSTMIFGSIFNPLKYQEEIFSMACHKYLKRKEGVTLEDVISSSVGLIDALILVLSTKV